MKSILSIFVIKESPEDNLTITFERDIDCRDIGDDLRKVVLDVMTGYNALRSNEIGRSPTGLRDPTALDRYDNNINDLWSFTEKVRNTSKKGGFSVSITRDEATSVLAFSKLLPNSKLLKTLKSCLQDFVNGGNNEFFFQSLGRDSTYQKKFETEFVHYGKDVGPGRALCNIECQTRTTDKELVTCPSCNNRVGTRRKQNVNWIDSDISEAEKQTFLKMMSQKGPVTAKNSYEILSSVIGSPVAGLPKSLKNSLEVSKNIVRVKS